MEVKNPTFSQLYGSDAGLKTFPVGEEQFAIRQHRETLDLLASVHFNTLSRCWLPDIERLPVLSQCESTRIRDVTKGHLVENPGEHPLVIEFAQVLHRRQGLIWKELEHHGEAVDGQAVLLLCIHFYNFTKTFL